MSGSDMYSQKSALVYTELRLEGNLTDAVIKVKDAEFPIHKAILCSCSLYFRALFTRWSTRDKEVFEIPGVSPDMMQLIIDFAYTGKLAVTEDNVQELLMAADQFNVMAMIQACGDFLEDQLCPENCIGIWRFTHICLCQKLQHTVYKYIIDNFERVVFSEELQDLSAQELVDIMKRDDLNVRNESIVFHAIQQWIAFDPEDRKQHFGELLSTVRLALPSEKNLRIHVMSNDLVTTNPTVECLEMVHAAMQISDWMIANRCLSGVFNPVGRPRLPNVILLAFGGWSGGSPTNGVEAYDSRTGHWINVTNNRESPRAYHDTAFLNGYVYCVGGFDQVECFNTVRIFDLRTRTWHEAAPMHHRRCYVSVTVLNGYIYALGGYDGVNRLNTAERYWPETNQWGLIPSMHEQRSDASCTTLHKKIYICGGFNGQECLQTCECYCPKTNQWTMITPMSTLRSGIGVIAYAERVFAVGGFDGNGRLRSVEAYNPQTNTWQAVSFMMTPRSNFGIEVFNNQLFVVGGFNGFTTTSKAECYDESTNQWSKVCDMDIFRSALSCSVVSGLPNMAEYTVPRDTLPLLQVENLLVHTT